MYVHIKCPTLSAGSSRERGLDRRPLVKTDWPSCCLTFLRENLKTDLWSQIMRILHYQKTEDPKKDHLLWQQHVLVLLVRKKKNSNNKLILTAKTRRKSNISQEWIYEMHIFRFETQTFLEQNTLLRIVKLLEFKTEADELLFFFNLENKPA